MRRILAAGLAVALAWGGLTAGAEADILYVSEYGGGSEDGSSWDDALYSIQDALDAAQSGDEIWVAEGTYFENLIVSKDVSLYGGFAGNESYVEDRDLSSYVTTIDADLNGNALTSVSPAISVLDGFRIINGTGFNGFGGGVYISDFRGVIANVTFEDNFAQYGGGGLYLSSNGTPDPDTVAIQLNDVTFDNNQAGSRGGGLFVESHFNESPVDYTLGNVEFNGNSAGEQGGGFYLESYQSSERTLVVFENASFAYNTATEGGGAYIDNEYYDDFGNYNAEFNDCWFENNTAPRGGGLYTRSRVYALWSTFRENGITNSEEDAAGGAVYTQYGEFQGYQITFENNSVSATAGASAVGGAAATENGGLYLSLSTFEGNSAQDGGAVYVGKQGNSNLTRCTVKGNTASANGGAVIVYGGGARLETNLIVGNTAAGYGGAIVFDHSPTYKSPGYLPLLLNNTISDNHAPGGGAAVDIRNRSNIAFTNNIVAFNDSGVQVDATSRVIFRSNDVHGNLPGGDFQGVASPTGTLGNIADDPLFVNRAGGDYHLAPTSPARDAGDTGPFYYFSSDLDGNKRARGPAVDIGAYETEGVLLGNLEFDTQPGNGAAPGPLPTQPVVRLNKPSGGTDTSFNGPVTVTLKPGTGSPGAALGGTTTVNAVNGVATFTDISLDRAGVAFVLTATAPGALAVDSYVFTITVLNARVSPAGDDGNDGATWATAKRTVQAGLDATQPGGAVWLAAGEYNDNVWVRGASLLGGFAGTETDAAQRDPAANVVIVDGLGWTDAINVQNNGGAPITFDGMTIRNAFGSGILNFVDNATISNNIFTGNGGDYGGGGVMSFGDNLRVTRNRFDGNTATSRGGAISISYSTATIDNNLFRGNAAPRGSALDAYGYSPIHIVNNTIVEGVGGEGAIALSVEGAVVANNIVAGNGSGIFRAYATELEPTLNNNLVFGNTAFNYNLIPAGAGDISAEPLFVNAGAGNYRLQPTSPAVDAGDDSFLSLSAWDLAGNPRQNGAHVDIGAYEWLVAGPSMGDAIRAMKIAGGLLAADGQDLTSLNVEDTGASQNRVDTLDALRLLREVIGNG